MIDCNDCPHINITEEQQEQLWRLSNKTAKFPHICTKHNQRVLHYPYREPIIHPCKQCENDNWISTPDMWTYELNHNPQNFYRNGNGELIWLGYKVEVIMTFSGAEEKFWALADKIIPKENPND